MIDTAGIRRRGRVEGSVERWSVDRSLKSLERSDLALLLLDAQEGVVEQDTKIAGQILKKARGCIILVNKWDLRAGDPKGRDQVQLELSRRFAFLAHASVLYLSAFSRESIPKVFSLIERVMTSYTQRIPTGDLNRFLQKAVSRKSPPAYRGRPVRLYYLTQVGVRPPVFAIFSNYPAGIPPSYSRYLENHLRQVYGFSGVPIQILMRKRK